MIKFRNIFLFFIILFCNTFVSANEKCSEERKQWVEFYKQNFINDFGKVNFSNDPCLIDIINQDDKNKIEVDNAVKNIFSDVKSEKLIELGVWRNSLAENLASNPAGNSPKNLAELLV